jgi:hypothetical protein
MMPTMSQKDDRCFIVVYEQQIPAARRITKELDATREMGWNNAYYRHHVKKVLRLVGRNVVTVQVLVVVVP